MIKVTGLSKKYRNFNNQEMIALKDLSFEAKTGEIISFVGPSGCGKTTLLKIIGGLLEHDNGAITLSDKKHNVQKSFMFQEPILLPWRSIRKNIELPLEIQKQKNYKIVDKLLSLVRLKDNADKLPEELSGGMRQRTALARSLVNNPEVMFMDEPFSALDDITRGKIGMEFLKIQKKLKFTCFFVTHSISEAVLISDRVFVLSESPAKIVSELVINLEKPRCLEMKDTPEFIKYTKCIRTKLKNSLQQ